MVKIDFSFSLITVFAYVIYSDAALVVRERRDLNPLVTGIFIRPVATVAGEKVISSSLAISYANPHPGLSTPFRKPPPWQSISARRQWGCISSA